MQKRYWKEMVDTKFKLVYIDYYLEKSYGWNEKISMCNALASSASIAGWAIWNNIPYFWSCIIAASQVFTAVKPHLPYNKRVKNLTAFISEASSIFLEYEYNWFKVANGDLTDNEINEKIKELKDKLNKTENNYIAIINLPIKDDIEKKAEERTDLYFKKYE